MANLLPPSAKKAVVTEYWIRVATLWLILAALGLAVVLVLRFPTYVLVQSQLHAFSREYTEAQGRSQVYEDARAAILDGNTLVALLLDDASTTTLSDTIALLDTIAGRDVLLNRIELAQSDGAITAISVSGIASTRRALADFSKNVREHPQFEDAELPISNLAKDKDISFSITVTPATP